MKLAGLGDGRWMLQWVDPDSGKRQTFRFTATDEAQAERLAEGIDRAVKANQLGDRDPWVEAWAASLGDAMHARLAGKGLFPARAKRARTLGKLLDLYFESMQVKPSTRRTVQQTRDSLQAHFGADRALTTIGPLEAEAWRQSMAKAELAPATISKRVKTARAIFKAAMLWELVPRNPFAGLKAGAQVNPSRAAYISPEDMAKVLEAAPDVHWRTLLVLCRYGGMRFSEAMALMWDDVDWHRGRVTVRSPKTAHQGKPARLLPLFPELERQLREAFEAAPDRAVYCIGGGLRRPNANLRTALERIIRRAGLEPWPRLFHNLRASRQTELARDHPLKAVCSWLGNTEAVAMSHYLQVTDADFDKALARPEGAAARCIGAADRNGAPPDATPTHASPTTRKSPSQRAKPAVRGARLCAAAAGEFGGNDPKGIRTPVFTVKG